MPMTDAPNFGTKFGRRKPCLRYIGPLLRTTSVAPVGRGDLTPPSWTHRPAPVPRRGRAPSRPVSKVRFPRQFPLVSERLPSLRRGGPMCPPVNRSREEPCPVRHIGRPLQILPQPPSTPEKRNTFPKTRKPIIHSQFSIIHYPFPHEFTITNYHPPGGPYV